MTRPANTPPSRPCAFGDGRHEPKATQFGMVCPRCSMTWEWQGRELVATWDLIAFGRPPGREQFVQPQPTGERR